MTVRGRLPVVAVIVATVLVATLTVVTSPRAKAAPGAPLAAARVVRTLPWASGSYIPGDDPRRHDAFSAWRGAAATVAVTWPTRQRWPDLTNPAWLLGRWQADRRTLVLGMPPFPEAEGASLATCATGAYDARWRAFGDAIAAAGMAGRTIIRLGWEFNGDWYAWAARDPGAFAACWRRVHAAAESRAPGLRWDWSVNRGPSQLGIDPRAAYPGDAYVDIVGVDSYDGWPAATSEAGWAVQYAGSYGLRFWADFARQHRRKLSVPEWGVYPGTAWAGHNGGDNPFYVAKMFGFFKEQKDILAYEAYFNEPATYYAGALHLNQRAAWEYMRQLRMAAPRATVTSP